MERLAYSVKEAGEALGVSARTIVREIQRGRLNVIRIGRRVVIPAQSLAEFVKVPTFSTDPVKRPIESPVVDVKKPCSVLPTHNMVTDAGDR